MATFTTRLNVTKPASSENVSITTLNNDFDLFDAAVGATVGASASKPASAFSGRLWYETNTGLLKVNTAASASTAADWDEAFVTTFEDVRKYGAVANSLASSAVNNVAFAVAASTGNPVFLPDGTWYGTFDLDPPNAPRFFSTGGATVCPASGHYFIDANRQWDRVDVEGITFDGGAGAIRNRYTSDNVTYLHRVVRNRFLNYTGAAISHNSSDMPVWKIESNVFYGANDTSTIGVALKGLTDLCSITDNEFQKNKVHIKLGSGGNNAKISGNDFVQYVAASAGNLRAMLWVIPQTSSTNAGAGMVARDNKYGNENIGADDYRVLYADESSGTYFGDKLPTIAADSTGYIVGHIITDSLVTGGASSNPIVYSTTPNVRSSFFTRLAIGGSNPSYVLQFRTTTTTPDPERSSNIIGPMLAPDNNFTPFTVSNQKGVGTVVDPQGILRTSDQPIIFPGGNRSSGYVNLLQQRINSFTLGSATTKASITDAVGGGDATEVTFGTEIYCYVPTSALVTDKPIFVEFDLLQGSSSALTSVIVQVGLDSQANGNHFRRTYAPDASWRSHRMRIQSSDTSNSTLLKFKPGSGSSGTKVKIGRVRMYHAYEPVMADPEYPSVETTTSAPGAGGAGALPATPLGYTYEYINISGTMTKVRKPYYAG